MFNLKKKPATTKTKLSDSLKRTRTGLFSGLLAFGKRSLTSQDLEELEDQLLLADIGIKTTSQIIDILKIEARKNPDKKPLDLLKEILLPILSSIEKPFEIPTSSKKPFLILVVGVNGVGKTTTIGKLTKLLQNQGKSVLLAAGDTFRAAAIEQLQVWGKHNDVKVIAQNHGADAGAVIYDALKSARAKNIDILIADTAGRLHNKDHLMEEIKKIYRINKKFDAELQNHVMLVLDAGSGQNALAQAKRFNDALGLDSLVLTKLDGTTKGGIIFPLASELNIPIHFIGIGEKIEDLRAFNAKEFVEALLKDKND